MAMSPHHNQLTGRQFSLMVSLIEEPEVVFGNVGIESYTITSPF
jgi:hypothetical protein